MAEPRLVLITRPEPAAAETARQVAGLGYRPVSAPLLRIRRLPAKLPAGLPTSADAVLVTSSNALPALPGALRDTPLLVVGDGTARRATEAGFTQVRSAGGDAGALAGLARLLLPSGATLLLASGAGQGLALAATLRNAGFRVHRRAVYAAHPAARLPPAATAALQSGLHAALFLSAETAHAFARLLPEALQPRLAGVVAITIGQSAADSLSPLPWRQVRVSVRPTLDHVLALL